MAPTNADQRSLVFAAALAAGLITTQFVAGKAARDALFLTSLDVAALPTIVIVSALFSIGFVTLASRGLKKTEPSTFVPVSFIVSGALFLVLWSLAASVPRFVAVATYLLVSGVGPMLGSGFWLIATEAFDPRSAKKHFGTITATGTLGGLLGGVLAERVAATAGISAILPCLAGLNAIAAWQVRRLAVGAVGGRTTEATPFEADVQDEPARPGLQVLAREPYLRSLATLVLLGTISAGLLDYLFKAEAAATVNSPAALLRFFAVYYGAVSLLTFLIQASTSRWVLEKLGLATAVATPSAAVILGSLAGLVAPGLGTAIAARGGESLLRGSLFRAGYELFYTPVSVHDKRAAKSWIDVVFDRLGEAVGGGLVRIVLLLQAGLQSPVILALAAGFSAAALFVTTRLNRGYISTLEGDLRRRAIDIDLVSDITTRSALFRSQSSLRKTQIVNAISESRMSVSSSAADQQVDPALRPILAIRSRDRDRVREALQRHSPLPPTLIPHVVPLLAWDAVSADAGRALATVADQHVGSLVDALIDPDEEFSVRRRLARVLAACSTPRGVEGLVLGLSDRRFEVRFQCAQSLLSILQKHDNLHVDRDRVFEIVQRETTVSRLVWEGRRLLDQTDEASVERDFSLDELVRDRANRSLAHIFTLLSLVLPGLPLRVAFRGLHTDDLHLRGTALEYLEGVLPPAVRESLWPFLDDSRPTHEIQRPREEIMADLLRSNQSILINLETLRHQMAASGDAGPSEPGIAPERKDD